MSILSRASLPRLVGLVLATLPSVAVGAAPTRFVPPETRAEWEVRRPVVARAIESALGLSATATPVSIFEGVDEREGFRIERFHFEGASGKSVRGLIVLPRRDGSARVPGVIYLGDGPDAALRPGLDGLPPAIELARRGIAALWIEVDPTAGRWTDPASWPTIVRDDLASLDLLAHRPEVDSNRLGVVGLGLGGTRAAWLMALRDRVGCGFAIGGLTRLADLRTTGDPLPPWRAAIVDGLDLEAMIALGAGRTFEWTVGDRDPSSPPRGVGIVDEVGKSMDRLMGPGGRFHVTRLGERDDHYGRLPWMGALEAFDKAFFPQRPTPLAHPPEPEPSLAGDPAALDLASAGLAGWVPEMSQRPGTWTWSEGVIACQPGPDEYGWLRAPVEVGDFVLSIEWRVPAGGNSGIFLRGKPVPWAFPPSPNHKRVVSNRGLDWPSRTGLELQAQDDGGSANKYSSGSLYRHAAPTANPSGPPGTWNRYTVRARGPRVEVWSNGVQVLDDRIDTHPLTLVDPPLRGYIGLQNHGAPAEFRNVRLLRLGP